MQHPLIVAQVELAGERRGGAVSGNFIVFELLRRRDQSGVAKVVALLQRQHFLGFVHERFHRLIGMGAQFRAMILQD